MVSFIFVVPLMDHLSFVLLVLGTWCLSLVGVDKTSFIVNIIIFIISVSHERIWLYGGTSY